LSSPVPVDVRVLDAAGVVVHGDADARASEHAVAQAA